MRIDFEIEKLWRRDCKDCTHAYYLPYKEESGFVKVLRWTFGVKKKFKEPCPVCGSKRVRTTRLVKRKIINRNKKE